MSAGSGHRAWSFTKGAKLPGVEKVVWSFTLADVNLETGESYCAAVKRWAESILADTEEFIRSVDTTASP